MNRDYVRMMGSLNMASMKNVDFEQNQMHNKTCDALNKQDPCFNKATICVYDKSDKKQNIDVG